MMVSSQTQLRFEPPETLPNLQAKVPGSRKYDSMTKSNIENAITAILNKKYSEADGIILIRFMRRMANNPFWIQSNTSQAQLVMRAAAMLYINTEESSVTAKIRRVVQKKSNVLALCTLSDLNITFGQELKDRSIKVLARPYSSLFLACRSPVFDRMFRGNNNEAVNLRQAYASSSIAYPVTNIDLHVDPDIFETYLDIITTGKNDKRPKLPETKEVELISYVDMTDSLKALLRAQEDIVFRHMTPNLAFQVCDLFFQEESIELEKCKKRSMPQVDPQKKVEERFIKNLNPQNALVLYDIAQAKDFKRLAIQALDLIVNNVSMMQAYKGAVTHILQSNERSFSGDDVAQACFNWFLKRLPQVFKDLDHKVPSDTKSFLKSSVEFCRLSLQDLKISPGLQTDSSHNSAHEFIDKFKEVVAHIRVVRSSALQELTEKELTWLLKQLPDFISELDLSDCNFSNFDLLRRFECLRVLKLSGLMSVRSLKPLQSLKIEQLDVSHCKNLCEVDVTPFTRLTNLDLTGCPKLPGIDGLRCNRTLRSVAVDSGLQPLLRQYGFE